MENLFKIFFSGRFCEMDKDECAIMPKICNHGVCVNVPGSYQCYCKPGMLFLNFYIFSLALMISKNSYLCISCDL